MARRVAVGWALGLAFLAVATSAGAQTGSSGTSTGQSSTTTQTPSSSTAAAEETRPATTTFFGDTGLWFVPTAEVLPDGKWSASGYRRGTNYIQGYTNVGDFAGTFAYGLKNKAEIFGSFLVDTRIDRDVRPVFVNDPTFGGVIDRYPQVNRYWTGDNIGDFYIGAKYNIWTEYHEEKPAAIAVRGIFKLPTGSHSNGVSTGKLDFAIDAIVSKEFSKKTELSGYGGFEFRGSPDNFDAPGSAFRWGFGVGVPSRGALRFTGELEGIVPSSGTLTNTGARVVGIDSTLSPLISNTEALTRATAAITYQTKKGLFFGAGLSWNFPTQARNTAFSELGQDPGGDYVDYQFRIGFHPGVRLYVPPPPPPPVTPPPAAPAPVHDLSVRAACDPCTVEVGKSSTVTATVTDSINCSVTYRWAAPSGTLAQPAERQTLWTAPNTEGTVPVTVTVTCPSDGKTASATTNIQVIRPAVRSYTFEDVHFDFDRYSLRPEATRVLDEAVSAMRQDATLRLTIEGHTCNIGTAEYNLALGNRRANAVRDYLVSRGITTDRLNTVSYGEERPKYDNAREETRRLTRRAALTVRLQ
jgi:outer membrane protein OmpA-like peptidoglycan-associated protein